MIVKETCCWKAVKKMNELSYFPMLKQKILFYNLNSNIEQPFTHHWSLHKKDEILDH